MAEVSLELFKKHVKADDFSQDDALLQYYLDNAEAAIVRNTHRTREELEEMGGGSLPSELALASMMLAAHWYNQRESAAVVQMHQVPDSLSALVKPFRKLA
jgi:hypothetical protein